MNWKEQLRNTYTFRFTLNPIGREVIEDFISTEIIEKLIADIEKADLYQIGLNGELWKFKQQLRDKWL